MELQNHKTTKKKAFMMYVCATSSKALLNYATNPRISFIVHPCLVNLLQLMEGKSVSLCDFWKTSIN